MYILNSHKKGDVNGIPEEIYQLQWCLKNINGETIIASNWVNKRSYYNNDGWNSISYTNSINQFKDIIHTLEINCKDSNCTQLAISVEFSTILNVSYSFVRYIQGYDLIVGLCIELKDKYVEFMIDGNVYTNYK